MKKGFIGLRLNADVKKASERIASLENVTLSEWVELQLKLGIENFNKKQLTRVKQYID